MILGYGMHIFTENPTHPGFKIGSNRIIFQGTDRTERVSKIETTKPATLSKEHRCRNEDYTKTSKRKLEKILCWSKPGARVTCNRGTKVGPCRAPRPRQFGARMGKRISRLIGIPKILGVGEPVVHTFLRPSPPHEP